MRVGIVGLGLMGKAMAERLLAAGHVVSGYDLRAEAREQAAALGVDVLEDACSVAESAEILMLSLMTSDDRRVLLWGEQAVARVLKDGATVLDTTTARPEDVEADHARLAAIGVRLIDVCVSGSSQVVSESRAIALVGCAEADAAAFSPLLTAFTKAQYYFGEAGSGCRAKLIVNTVFGLNRLVLAEALALARDGGFDPGLMLEVLRHGETYSVAMDTKGPKMVARDYAPTVARLEQHAKDVELILEYARSVGAEVPVSRAHRDVLRRALKRGAGPLDNAAIFEAYTSGNS